MEEEFKLQKSRLRSQQVQELKALEKELKKKKGSLRDGLEQKIEEMKQKHQKELDGLIKKHGTAETARKGAVSHEDELSNVRNSYYFSERNWTSLGKKELEIEAAKRGLGKQGNREKLVTKLMIFHTDQKKKVADGLINPTNTYPEEKHQKGRKAVDSSNEEYENKESVQPNASAVRTVSPGASRFLAKKRAPAEHRSSPSNEESHKSSETSSASEDEDESESENELNDGNRDELIADIDKIKGRQGDARGAQKREVTMARKSARGKRGGGGNNYPAGSRARGNNNDRTEELSTLERQQKRERVMQKVLKTLLEKKPEGVLIEDLGLELRRLKVQNFAPELLGYDSIEEWIENQPSQVLYFDTEKRKICPSRAHIAPPSDIDEE